MVAAKAPHVEVPVPAELEGSELRRGQRLQVSRYRGLDNPRHVPERSERLRSALRLPPVLSKVVALCLHCCNKSFAELEPAFLRGLDPVQAQSPGHAVDIGPAGHLDEVIRLPAEAATKSVSVQECI